METTHQQFAMGLFSNRHETEKALKELKEANFPMDKVSIIARGAESNEEISGAHISDRIDNKNVGSPAGAVLDAVTGAFWGGLLVGLTSLVIPGAGPIIAAGSFGIALATAVAGTAVGTVASVGLVKALEDWGIPTEHASIYGDRLIQGDDLIIVDGTDSQLGRAQEILSDRKIHHWGIYSKS